MIPYKDQNLDYLQGIEKDPTAYRGQVVSFGGEVAGITEDALRLRLVMKIDAPLYYYATGKGNALSYEMLLVSFNKRGMPQMTGIKKGHSIKVLARVSSYETRKNFTGNDIAVLHLIAFALSDHTARRDFFRPETPDRQLYESWKEGKLFFEESAQDVINRCPKEKAPQLPERFRRPLPPAPAEPPAPAGPEKGIVFDEEEPAFILPPDPQPTVCPENEPAPSAEPQAQPRPETISAAAQPETQPADANAPVSAAPADTDDIPAAPANTAGATTPSESLSAIPTAENAPTADNNLSAASDGKELSSSPADETAQPPDANEAAPSQQSAQEEISSPQHTSPAAAAPSHTPASAVQPADFAAEPSASVVHETPAAAPKAETSQPKSNTLAL